MLEADSVAISFNGRQILSGSYINCRKGEILGLLGRNGSGKSTLLKIIFGSLKADFKHLRIDGKIIQKGFQLKSIAYLPQENFLPTFLNTGDVLQSLGKEAIEKSKQLAVFNTKHKHRLRDLSAGELRFLECFWILFQPAPYILLDEPFMGLAPIYVELIQELIKEKSKEKGIILTDHNYQPLLQISHRIVLLHNNSIYKINTESDLVQHQYLPG